MGFFLFDLGWYYAMYCLDVNILKFNLDAVWYRHYPNNVKNTFLEKRGYFKEKRRIPYIFTDPWTIETRIILHSYVYSNKKVSYWEVFFFSVYLDNLVADKLGCQRHLLHTMLPRELEEGWSKVCFWSWPPDHTSRNTGHSTKTSLPILHQLIYH